MEMQTNEKIRVRLESFNHELLDFSCKKILNLIQENQIINIRSVPLPTDNHYPAQAQSTVL